MSKILYDENFYKNRHQRTLYAAVNILTLVSQLVPKINSAVDFGCGVGTWIQVLQNMGTQKILGIEGEWLNKEQLVIKEEYFMYADLTEKIVTDEKFDLAISLEVAEHLEEQYASTYVESLTHAADFILFSAAIPYQNPGPEHVNEQWPHYWINLFKHFDFKAIDCIRGMIWNDSKIDEWYRQNIMLFVKDNRIQDLNLEKIRSMPNLNGLALVHPDQYLTKI